MTDPMTHQERDFHLYHVVVSYIREFDAMFRASVEMSVPSSPVVPVTNLGTFVE